MHDGAVLHGGRIGFIGQHVHDGEHPTQMTETTPRHATVSAIVFSTLLARTMPP